MHRHGEDAGRLRVTEKRDWYRGAAKEMEDNRRAEAPWWLGIHAAAEEGQFRWSIGRRASGVQVWS